MSQHIFTMRQANTSEKARRDMCSYCCVTCLWNVFFASRSLACYLKITHWGAIMHWHIWFSDIHLHLCQRFSRKKKWSLDNVSIVAVLWDLSTKGLTAARIASRHQHKAGLWAEGQWCKSPDGLKTAGKVPSCTLKKGRWRGTSTKSTQSALEQDTSPPLAPEVLRSC